MQLIYKEYYNVKKKEICPLIQIGYNENEKYLIPNFEVKLVDYDIQEDIFITSIPFSNGLFSNIKENTKEIINTLISFGISLIKKNYINCDVWNYFLFTSSIKFPSIQKNIETYFWDKVDNKNIKYKDVVDMQNYYLALTDIKKQNINNIQLSLSKLFYNSYSDKKENNKIENIKLKYKMIKFNSEDFNQQFINKIENNADMIISYSTYCKNELELIYSFLNIIFSTNHDYKLFNCFNCEGFFVDTHASLMYCPYCKKIIQEKQKRKYYAKEITTIENRVDSKYYSAYVDEEIKNQYIKEKKTMKGKCKNNQQTLKEWYLKKEKEVKYHKS